MINNDIIANKNKKIIYKIKKEGKFNSFELNSELNRFIYTNEELDVTIIELKKSDNINHFLEIDDNIINSGDNSGYINESIYVIQYPKGRLSLSSGIVADIDAEQNNNFCHLCSTDEGSSGSPILKVSDNKLIGIHKIGNSINNYNKGLFLNKAIKSFRRKYYNSLYKINNTNQITNYKNSNVNYKPNLIKDKGKNYEFIYPELDISHKKGLERLIGFAQSINSMLNSIIQMLTSLKDIYVKVNKVKNNFYVPLNKQTFIAYFYKVIDEMYSNKGYKNPSLKEILPLITSKLSDFDIRNFIFNILTYLD